MDDQDQISQEGFEDASANGDTNQATILLNLEGLIKGHLSSIEKIQQELNREKENLDSIFEGNPTFREHADRVKEANKVKSTTRAEIMKQPSVMGLANKIKGLAAEVKERHVELSDYLQEYQRLTGSNVLISGDEEWEIVNSPKIIKKSK